MKKFLFFFILFGFLSGCQSAKDALTLKKKESSDEFLVEKKSPLVLPPNFGDLPMPNDNKKMDNDQNNEIQVSLGKDKLKIDETIKNSKPTSLEKSVLEKIK